MFRHLDAIIREFYRGVTTILDALTWDTSHASAERDPFGACTGTYVCAAREVERLRGAVTVEAYRCVVVRLQH